MHFSVVARVVFFVLRSEPYVPCTIRYSASGSENIAKIKTEEQYGYVIPKHNSNSLATKLSTVKLEGLIFISDVYFLQTKL